MISQIPDETAQAYRLAEPTSIDVPMLPANASLNDNAEPSIQFPLRAMATTRGITATLSGQRMKQHGGARGHVERLYEA